MLVSSEVSLYTGEVEFAGAMFGWLLGCAFANASALATASFAAFAIASSSAVTSIMGGGALFRFRVGALRLLLLG